MNKQSQWFIILIIIKECDIMKNKKIISTILTAGILLSCFISSSAENINVESCIDPELQTVIESTQANNKIPVMI